MKQIYSLLFLLLATLGFAQAPAGYYTSATGSGYTLKTQLYNIIKDHTVLTYGDLYVTYQTSDIDNFYENDGTVLDMYSENPAGADPYNFSISATQRCTSTGYSNEGDCYNREHIIPQSIFGEALPMVSDAHFITPTDGQVNGIRSNFPHATVAVPNLTTQNGSKRGPSTTAGYTGEVFEPIDEFKGDIARMYFYFATRYQNTVAGYNYPMFNKSSNKVFTNAFLAQLIAWHNQDPVSAREVNRNNAIYARQNNRNPYIDNPTFVTAVWTTEAADTEAPTAATNLLVTTTTSNSATLTWTAATDNIGVTGYDLYIDGVFKSTFTGVTATVTGLLPSTTYNFYLISRDDERNSSVASAIVSGITTATPTGGSGATDLFFSEYVEGSGNNKALEIANFTGAAVNLVGYAVKKQSNGAGTWSTGFNLTGTLSTGQVFLIVDPGISTTCYTAANANLLSTSSELYNGNDPIGLFKNGVLIDIIGTFNGGSSNNFAADVTLRRKPSISAPNITYNETAEWDAYGKDVCNGLGAHSITNLSTGDVNSNDFTIYPNPSTGTVKINFSNGAEKHTIQIFTILGQQVYENEFSNSPSATINNLQKGFYLIKIKNETNSVTKKLIVN